jgi:hypothetical protein
MKKLLTYAIAASCLVAFVSVAQARSAYDGSWDLLFVTQRGACDPTYNFSINITNGAVTHPNLEVQGLCGAFGRRPRLSERSGQICVRRRSALEQFRSRDMERLFGRFALLRVLDRPAELTFSFRLLTRPNQTEPELLAADAYRAEQ